MCEWSGRHSLRIFYQDKLYEVRTNLPQQTGGHYLPPQTPGYPGGCAGVCILRDAGVTSISLWDIIPHLLCPASSCHHGPLYKVQNLWGILTYILHEKEWCQTICIARNLAYSCYIVNILGWESKFKRQHLKILVETSGECPEQGLLLGGRSQFSRCLVCF